MLHRLRQQPRNEGIQTLATQTLHRAQIRTAAQVGQTFQRFAGIDETCLQQLTTRCIFILGLFPQRQPLATDHNLTVVLLLVVRIRIGIGDDLTEMPGHPAAPVHQPLVKAGPVGKAHDQGDARLILFVVRQHLRLAVGNRLNGVLGVAQKFVAFAQLFGHRRGQITLPFEGFQHVEQRTLLQAQVAATVDQLERLGDELDFANSAGTELDVFRHALALHFLLNQLLHGAQRFDGREIQVTAIHKRSEHLEQFGTRRQIAADHSRLDHRVAFPVPALILVILLQRIEAEHQRPGRTVRPQAHVNAEHKAVNRHRVQRLDQPLAQANEKLLIVQCTLGADRLATFRVGENKVDVRRQVQLDRAEFAHAENDHLLRQAGMATGRRTELLTMAWIEPLVGKVDRGIGHFGKIAAGFDQICLTGQIAPDDSHLLACALPT